MAICMLFNLTQNTLYNSSADIDECIEGSNNCSEFSYCTNNIGSYECMCFSGYLDQGSGYVCTGECKNCIVLDNVF